MSDVVIRVENLYKEYRLGTISHGTLYKDLQSWWARIRGKEDPNSIISSSQPVTPNASRFTETENPHMLALNDLSFEVKRGEVLGIIGRNGAGKSTLLKILSEVTSPTKGQVKIKGRVASLLEVGTGFHPELTGRENVYLNGAILGMTKTEIDNKFDEIVAFAEIEKFIDTPVKRYSSGMYVRLAFAVAAHLEPEILIVDEVLAVGDASFQKKCLGKMGDVAKEGRTVLFVSHNMPAVQNLCQRAILLDSGQIIENDKPNVILEKYLSNSEAKAIISLAERCDRQGTGDIRFTAVQFRDEKGDVDSFISGKFAKFACYFENKLQHDLKNFHLAIGIDDQLGNRIAVLSSEVTNEVFANVPSFVNCVEVNIGRLPLAQGRYGFTIFSRVNGEIADWIQKAGFFAVEPGDFYGTGRIPTIGQGNFLMDYNFNLLR